MQLRGPQPGLQRPIPTRHHSLARHDIEAHSEALPSDPFTSRAARANNWRKPPQEDIAADAGGGQRRRYAASRPPCGRSSRYLSTSGRLRSCGTSMAGGRSPAPLRGELTALNWYRGHPDMASHCPALGRIDGPPGDGDAAAGRRIRPKGGVGTGGWASSLGSRGHLMNSGLHWMGRAELGRCRLGWRSQLSQRR